MARVPAGFGVTDVMGVRRPSRAVSLGDARNPESVADAGLLAQLMAASSEPHSREQSLRTAGEVVRPMQLRDLGMSGMMGMVPLPLPGGAAGRGIAKGVGKGIRSTDDIMRAALRLLRGGDEGVGAVQGMSRLTPGRPNVLDEVGELVQPTLPGTSVRDMTDQVTRTGVDAARGSLPWTPAQGVPRVGKPGLGGSGAPAADARPLFRTERPAGTSILESMEEGLPPAGSNYYGNADGTVSRFKTQATASQTPKPDQWGWMDPGQPRYVNEEAAAAIRRQMQPNAASTVKWEWAGDQLELVDIATGKAIGAVYDAPRVGLQPFSSFPDGRQHLGDRIAQVFHHGS